MLRVLIVDDESLARLRLKSLLLECRDAHGQPLARVVGEAADATGALAALQAHAVDLVLLDVSMPGTHGLDLARLIRQSSTAAPPVLVFVTAHEQHALQAFELDAADYLTKPVRRARLVDALQRSAERLAAGRALREASHPNIEPLVVNDRGRVERVPMSEVLYLKAELKYVTLRTAERTHVLDESLADLELRLGDQVLRIHRNALVARHAVRALERRAGVEGAADDGSETWAVRIAQTDEWLAVSRRQVAAVREALGALKT